MNVPQNLLHSIDSWTKDDVQKWFEYCIDEYSLGDINRNDFQMNGKALLLLNEDGFKQRSLRSGDILHKALQQHQLLIKSLTCQTFPYSLWNSFPLSSPAFIRHFNFPLPPMYFPPAVNPEFSMRTRQISTSSSSSSLFVQPFEMNKIECLEEHQELIARNENDSTRQIRYYHDRIDFHGEILLKPPAAKNCRILWEFLYILLEDLQYQSIIHWDNREKMIFRIVQADKLAALWGLQKNRVSMTYEKLSRGMRYYYSNNIISKEPSKRLLYRFMRSPDEIRKNIKRPIISSPLTIPYLPLFPGNNLLFPPRNHSISKSDRSSSSSPESEESDKQDYHSSSTKRKQTIPISLTTRRSHHYPPLDQPLNLAVRKEEHFFNYKKQKLLYAIEQ